MEIIDFIKTNKIVAIARKVFVADIEKTANALFLGGIKILEITFDQESTTCIEDTQRSIEIIKNKFDGKMLVGAGTVLTVEQARAARQAGADFALSPDVNISVIKEVKSLDMISIPGALTPSEIMTAYNAGADIIKLFPAGILGIPYYKAIKGPISHVPLMAVGGISDENISTYIAAGFSSCGIGSNLVRNDLIKAGCFEQITEIAKKYASAIN